MVFPLLGAWLQTEARAQFTHGAVGLSLQCCSALWGAGCCCSQSVHNRVRCGVGITQVIHTLPFNALRVTRDALHNSLWGGGNGLSTEPIYIWAASVSWSAWSQDIPMASWACKGWWMLCQNAPHQSAHRSRNWHGLPLKAKAKWVSLAEGSFTTCVSKAGMGHCWYGEKQLSFLFSVRKRALETHSKSS